MFRNTKNLVERERIKDNMVLKDINSIFRKRSKSKEKLKIKEAKEFFDKNLMKVGQLLPILCRISMDSITQ